MRMVLAAEHRPLGRASLWPGRLSARPFVSEPPLQPGLFCRSRGVDGGHPSAPFRAFWLRERGRKGRGGNRSLWSQENPPEAEVAGAPPKSFPPSSRSVPPGATQRACEEVTTLPASVAQSWPVAWPSLPRACWGGGERDQEPPVCGISPSCSICSFPRPTGWRSGGGGRGPHKGEPFLWDLAGTAERRPGGSRSWHVRRGRDVPEPVASSLGTFSKRGSAPAPAF